MLNDYCEMSQVPEDGNIDESDIDWADLRAFMVNVSKTIAIEISHWQYISVCNLKCPKCWKGHVDICQKHSKPCVTRPLVKFV